jgi:hypothetical protein
MKPEDRYHRFVRWSYEDQCTLSMVRSPIPSECEDYLHTRKVAENVRWACDLVA